MYKYKISCDECFAEFDPFNVDTLIKSDYWPGNITNCAYLFHQNVFRMWDSFSKRMPGSSEQGFISSLSDLSVQKKRVGHFLWFFFIEILNQSFLCIEN